jgi:hypothetical protein
MWVCYLVSSCCNRAGLDHTCPARCASDVRETVSHHTYRPSHEGVYAQNPFKREVKRAVPKVTRFVHRGVSRTFFIQSLIFPKLGRLCRDPSIRIL